MRAFYSTRISEHLSETPEGFLLALSVPIARTGVQEYRASEIGLTREDGYQGEEIVKIYRDDAEVFSPMTISSFEGKPLVSPHPPNFVSAANIGAYQKGHVQHVRKGDNLPDGERALVADLVITDESLISRIKSNQIRELSAGYDCLYTPMGEGEYAQRGIRGNHVAVVGAGRAGEHVKILDCKSEEKGLMGIFEETLVKMGWKQPTADSSDPIINAEEFTAKGDLRTMERNNDEDRKTRDAVDKMTATADRMNKFLDAAEEKEKKAAKDAAEEKEEKEKQEKKAAKDAAEEKEKKEKEEKVKDAKECTCGAEKGETHDSDCPMYKAGESKDSELIPVEKELTGEELPKNPIPGAAKAADALRAIKPLVARRGTKDQKEAWNRAYAVLREPVTDESRGGGDNQYSQVLETRRPDGTTDNKALADPKKQAEDFANVARQFHRKNAGEVEIKREERK